MTTVDQERSREVLGLAELAREPLHPDLEPYVVTTGSGLTFVQHPLVFDLLGVPGLTNLNYRNARDRALEAERLGDWELYIWTHARPWRLPTLDALVRSRKIDRAALRDVLPQVWLDTEFPRQFGRLPRSLFRRAGFVTDAPNIWGALGDRLVVYRGATRKPGPNAISWTLARGCAEYFARRFGGRNAERHGRVWRGVVNRRDALGYFEGRSEAEVVVEPKCIFDIHTIPIGDDA